jgi:hypothetical protein
MGNIDKQSEQAREVLAQHKQHEELRQQAMRLRAEEQQQDEESEQAREILAQHKQHEKSQQEAMRLRAEEDLRQVSDSSVEAEARASMVDELHEAEHIEEAMLERSEEELKQN